MILRLLNPQGIAGLAASLCLALLLVLQKGETRHWKKQSGQFQQLYRDEQTAFAGTVANYRAAAETARAADKANAERAAAEQRAINQRSEHDYEVRLADARARAGVAAERLRLQAARSAADPGAGRAAPVHGLSAAAGESAQVAGQDRLSPEDALTATEQAIQLDELIKWVRQQHAVRVDGRSGERPQAAGAQAKVDNNASAVANPPDDASR
ncbi:MAG: hypothetical protein ACJ8D5_02055 [Sphingomicrobium sp.]